MKNYHLQTPRYTGPRPADVITSDDWWKLYGEAHDDPARLAVVCVYWGDKYPEYYVKKLRAAVLKHVSVPHDFYCVTSNAHIRANAIKWDVEVLTPPSDEPGWWQKIGLFKAGLIPQLNCTNHECLCTEDGSVPRRVLYLDLDVVVTGSLDPVLRVEIPRDGLVMGENFGPNKPQAAHNSSVMLWQTGTCAEIFDDYSADVRAALHGDQCWIWRRMASRIREFPVWALRSYKYDCRGRAHIPEGCRVVVFHGSPDPHECTAEEFVRHHWCTL